MRERSRRIKTLGCQAFNVPCNEEGRTFLRLMKKFINRPKWRFSARGRGPRKRPGDRYVTFSRQLSLPQEDSEWLAVYIGGTGGWGSFNAVLNPGRPRPAYYHVSPPTATPKGVVLSGEEKALVQKMFEQFEDDMTFVEPETQDLFYSAFEKLVDI